MPSATSTSTLAPSPTATLAPPPVDPGFTNTANRATEPLYENETWVVKNGDGLVMATWDTGAESWTYAPENIKVRQIFAGNEVDRAILEPFLGPLPPDDPATHFKDENGNPVAYGIGPETTYQSTGPKGSGMLTVQTTEVFVRYRGAVINIEADVSAIIFELPFSVDTSAILVKTMKNSNFGFVGTKNDGFILNDSTMVLGGIYDEHGIQRANENWIGNMVMIMVDHDNAHSLVGTVFEELSRTIDKNGKAMLDFLSGKTQVAPIFTIYDTKNGIRNTMAIPSSQFPLP